MKFIRSSSFGELDWVSVFSLLVIVLAIMVVLKNAPFFGVSVSENGSMKKELEGGGSFGSLFENPVLKDIRKLEEPDVQTSEGENVKQDVFELRPVELVGVSIQLREVRTKFDDADSGEIRNIEFFIRDGIRPRRLFPDASNVVIGYWPLFHNNVGFGASTVRILYQFVNSDSDGDGELTGSDRKLLAFSLPDGSNFTVLDHDVGNITNMTYLSESSELQLEFSQDGKVQQHVYSLMSGGHGR